MTSIRSIHISDKNFEKYGKVVLAPGGPTTAEAGNFKFWSDISHYSIQGETEIGICTVYREAGNPVTGVEQHKKTPEILIPIDHPFVLPLLLEGRPDEETEAFTVNPGEAVVINEGVWHAACLPVSADESSYFVIFRRNTPGEDVTKKGIGKITVEIG